MTIIKESIMINDNDKLFIYMDIQLHLLYLFVDRSFGLLHEQD